MFTRAVMLSVREFDLLVALARHAGRVVAHEALYRLAWGRALRHDQPPRSRVLGRVDVAAG